MVAKFRSIVNSDVGKIGNVVSSNVDMDTYSVLDSYSYDNKYDSVNIEQSVAQAHVRRVVRLTAPTFNHVLGRSNCTLLCKMLGMPTDKWNNIMSMEMIYNVDDDELVSIDEAYEGGRYLFGAQIAEHLIKELDIEEAKLKCLYNNFSNFLSSNTNPRDVFVIDKNSNDGMHLCADYYAHYDNAKFLKHKKRGYVETNFESDYKNALFPNGDTRLSYLLNMNPDKSGLYGMLNYQIVVVPVEMRPKIDNREHKLTKLYTKVIKANYELRVNIDSPNPKVVQAAYLNLERSVKRLQYKRQDGSSDVKPDDLAILERIKSKKGQIRMHNLGKRQDYSGRAVVCINPYLPIDVIRIPKVMLPKLLEYHILPYLAQNIDRNNYNVKMRTHVSNIYDRLRLGNLDNKESREEMIRIIMDEKLLEKVPFILGRQPTLHKHSLQGFHIELSDLQAIEVNPLVCVAFNMDFDGDQGHIRVPLSPEAILETQNLIMTTQNLFLPKTGECTTEPRQDMLYGLWTCTRDSYTLGQPVDTYGDVQEVRAGVLNHKIKVWDTVNVLKYPEPMLAGDVAFMACFPKGDVLPRGATNANGMLTVGQIDKKTITKYIDHLLRTDSFGNFIHRIGKGYASTETVVGCINALVELGFKVARLYPPNMSTIIPNISIPEYDNAIDDFYDQLVDIDFMYNMGLETSDSYKIVFAKHLDELNKTRRDKIIEKLGENNGFVKLSLSGARGSVDNLLQTFSIKGQVKKNETESFDALLQNSYASQLTPLEHCVAAYGGRQGQIDKSLKTGDTGYAMRKMWHATQGMWITCKDCGTTDGIEIRKKDLVVFVNSDDNEQIRSEVSKIFSHAIVGRYKPNSSKVITQSEADAWADDPSIDSVIIRSPLTCKNPCCSKCYGIEWSTHKPAVVGMGVGVIAAQSIGEPGTQLTLKTFQTGGVTGSGNVTSAFDKMDTYIHVADLAKLNKKGKYPGYDPLAWASGNIVEEPATDINMKVVKIENAKNKRLVVPKDIVLKPYAVKGEGLAFRHGDYDIGEILKYGDIISDDGKVIQPAIRTAQMYLMFKLYTIYKSEIDIRTIHFEVLVACMTRYMIVSTKRPDLMIGQYATSQELYRGSLANTEYIPRLIGVKRLPNASHDALDSIIMEAPVEGLSRACLLNMQDSLTKPINRMVMGLSILGGTNLPDFVDNRKEPI